MVWMSSVPGAVDALVGALRTAPGLDGVPVLDGPTVTNQAMSEIITVGFEDEATAAVVESLSEPEGLSRARDHETYSITCAVQVLIGASVDVPAARRRAYGLLGVVGDVLAGDSRLGGAVMLAALGAHTLSLPQTPQGVMAQIVFGVECDAFSAR
jgi:hypothetical protein